MDHEYKEFDSRSNNARSVFMGLLVGGLAGATAMLLFAPQSGVETRKQIEDKSIQLRDMTTDLVDDAVKQVRSKANKLVDSGRKSFNELKDQGQEMALEQLDHVSVAVEAGKNALQPTPVG